MFINFYNLFRNYSIQQLKCRIQYKFELLLIVIREWYKMHQKLYSKTLQIVHCTIKIVSLSNIWEFHTVYFFKKLTYAHLNCMQAEKSISLLAKYSEI